MASNWEETSQFDHIYILGAKRNDPRRKNSDNFHQLYQENDKKIDRQPLHEKKARELDILA